METLVQTLYGYIYSLKSSSKILLQSLLDGIHKFAGDDP